MVCSYIYFKLGQESQEIHAALIHLTNSHKGDRLPEVFQLSLFRVERLDWPTCPPEHLDMVWNYEITECAGL